MDTRVCTLLVASLCIVNYYPSAVYGTTTPRKAPFIIWSQRSHTWSKLRGISAREEEWTKYRHLSYVQSESIRDTHKYALGYNHMDNVIIWSDKIHHRISQQPLDDSLDLRLDTVQQLLTQGNAQFNGISSDYLTGATYFTEATRGWIGILGRGVQVDNYKVLYNTGVREPHDIVVDPHEGKLFWTEDMDPNIMTASSSGGLVRSLLAQNLRKPLGLTIDPPAKKLFWLDRGASKVESMSYDGTNRETVYEAQQNFFGVTMYENFLFITTADSLRLNIIDHQTKQFRYSFDVDAHAYDIVSTSKPKDFTSHDCQNKNCQHICLNEGNYKGRCTCKAGYFLNPDGITCSEGTSSVFLHSTGTSILSVSVAFDPFTDLVNQSLQIPVVKDPGLVARTLGAHHQNKLLFFESGNAIYSENLDTPEAEWNTRYELTMQTGDVQGIAIDWLSNTIYWSDYVLHHIMLSKTDGRYHRLVASGKDKGVGAPRGLAVNPLGGRMYWVNDTALHGADMDGTNMKIMVDNLYQAQSVTVDSRMKRIYWTDIKDSKIHGIDANGQNHIALDMRSMGMYGIAIFQDMLTWTKDNMGLQHCPVHSAEIYAHTTDSSFLATDPNHGTSLFEVVNYGEYSQPYKKDVLYTKCQENNGGCSQLCVPGNSPQSNSCACAIGFTLATDGTSCTSDQLEGSFLLYVDPYHRQIYHSPTGIPKSSIHGVFATKLLSYPTSVDLETETGKLYWIDQGMRQIMESRTDGSEERILLKYGSESNPKRLVSRPDMVYYIDDLKSSIMWINTETKPNPGVFVSDVNQPKALDIDTNGYVYWSSQAVDGGRQIERMREDGSGRKVLITGAGDITGIDILEEENLMYYCDSGRGLIGMLKLNDTSGDEEIVVQTDQKKFAGLAVDKSFIYFIVWNQKGITRVDRNNAKDALQIVDPLFARITDLKVYGSVNLVTATDGNNTLTYILAGVGAFLLLAILLIAVIVAAIRNRSRKDNHSEQNSGFDEPAQEYNNEEEWMGFDNPALFDLKNSSQNALHGGQQRGSTIITDTTVPEQTNPHGINPSVLNEAHANRGLNGATKTPLANAPSSGGMFKKKSSKRPPSKRQKPAPSQPKTFDLTEDQKVATVLQRIVGRMRNKLSSVKWSETDGRSAPQQPPDLTLNMPITPCNTSDGSPDNATKKPQNKNNKRYVYIPPKLHEPPRGWAPASHNVPMGGIKSSWGRAKGNKDVEENPDPDME